MQPRGYHLAIYLALLTGWGCSDTSAPSPHSQSIDAVLPQVSTELRSIPSTELCVKFDSLPEQRDLDYSFLGTSSGKIPPPVGVDDLKTLSIVAANHLLTAAPAKNLDNFIAAAGRRIGLHPRDLAAEIEPDGRIHLWNIRQPESPKEIGRFPACHPQDYNGAALDNTKAIPLAESVNLPSHLSYLNLGGAEAQVTWSKLRELTDFPSASTPEAFVLKRSKSSSIPTTTSKAIKILTFNTALLDYKVFGFLTVRSAPQVDLRRKEILQAVYLHDDIIGLQELWEPKEGSHFAAEAHRRGFEYFNPTKHHASNGLGIAIRRTLIDPSSPITHDVFTFTEQIPKEYIAASWTSLGLKPGIKRGFQLVTFRSREGVSFAVINTHFTAYRENWRIRLAQAQQLATLAMAQNSDVVILLGDLNGDIHYSADTFTNPNGQTSTGWTPNAYSTPLLTAGAGLDDWSTIGLGERFIQECYGLSLEARDSRCLPTWDHANSVVKQQYEVPNEPQGRLDFILGRSNRPILKPKATLVFNEKVTLANGEQSHLSDHMGVRVELRYEPEPPSDPIP